VHLVAGQDLVVRVGDEEPVAAADGDDDQVEVGEQVR
jgi:hypothetical protein